MKTDLTSLGFRPKKTQGPRGRRGKTKSQAWSTRYKDRLPDSAFLAVAPGGTKTQGRTHPLHLRSLPIKNAQGVLHCRHLRNALLRLPVTKDIAARKKPGIKRRAQKMLKQKCGGYKSKSKSKSKSKRK